MTQGIDIGRRLNPDEILFLKARGFGFVARYYDDTSGGNAKTLALTEIVDLLGAGLGILPVFETDGAGPWTVERGALHGQAAVREAARCGQPLGTPIVFAIDSDVDPASLVDYFNGVYSVLLDRFIIGVYGSYRVCKYARENFPALGFFWQTYAWSNAQVYPAADVLQHANGVTLRDGLVVDLDSATSPMPWRIA